VIKLFSQAFVLTHCFKLVPFGGRIVAWAAGELVFLWAGSNGAESSLRSSDSTLLLMLESSGVVVRVIP
jgi:hypothetical protein